MVRFTFSLPLFAALSLGCNASPTPRPVPSAEASATASAAPSAVGPRIVAVKPVHEFGKVKLGAVVEHTFKIRNEGSEPLKIAGARGS